MPDNQVKTIIKDYRVETTRVHKGTIAPNGKVFVVVRYKPGFVKYESSLLVISKMLNNENLEQLADLLFSKIKEKYKL